MHALISQFESRLDARRDAVSGAPDLHFRGRYSVAPIAIDNFDFNTSICRWTQRRFPDCSFIHINVTASRA